MFTVDVHRERAGFVGATPCHSTAWWELKLDLLLPCHFGLITTEIASALRVKSVVPAANAPFQTPQLADDLRRRGIRTAGSAGEWCRDRRFHRALHRSLSSAGAEDVYAFVRSEVRQRASEYLNQREQAYPWGPPSKKWRLNANASPSD